MEYLIKTKSIGGMTEEQFYNFCQENDSLKFERNANGEIIVMSPTGNITSWFNAGINAALYNWNKKTKLGIVLESNAGVTLPNNAVRSPDAAFIRKDRWNTLPLEDKKRFAHICPDFVIELKSHSDQVSSLKSKMNEYIEYGCLLGWLIDPDEKKTYIYRKDKSVEIVGFDVILNGENVLPGFTLDLREIVDQEI